MGGSPSVILPDPVVYLGGSDVLGDESFFQANEIAGTVSVCDVSVRTDVLRKLRSDERGSAGAGLEICHIHVQDNIHADLSRHFEDIVEFIFKIREKSFSDKISDNPNSEVARREICEGTASLRDGLGERSGDLLQDQLTSVPPICEGQASSHDDAEKRNEDLLRDQLKSALHSCSGATSPAAAAAVVPTISPIDSGVTPDIGNPRANDAAPAGDSPAIGASKAGAIDQHETDEQKQRRDTADRGAAPWSPKLGPDNTPINLTSHARAGVYVHCQAGISRSTTSCCAFLMTYFYPMTFREAVGHCHRCRNAICPNEAFREQLLVWEKDETGRRKKLHEKMRRTYERQFEPDFLRRDLDFIARKLQESEDAAAELGTCRYVYVSDGSALPRHMEDDMVEDCRGGKGGADSQSLQGNAERIFRVPSSREHSAVWMRVMPREDWERKNKRTISPGSGGVAAASDGDGEDAGDGTSGMRGVRGPRARNWGIDDLEGQKRRLRERFRGMERSAGGSVGLEWLLR